VFAGIVNKGSASLILSKAYGGMLALAQMMSADALDTDLQALLAGAAVASTAPAVPEKGAAKAEESKKDEPEKVSEEDAVAGLGALFG
jgi:large subunit ribosomal protein L10